MANEYNKEPGIRLIYNPSDSDKDCIRFVYDRKRQMEDSEDRQKAMKVFDKAEKLYEAWREDRQKGKWQSNHVTMEVFSVIETALSEITKQNLRPIILPRGKEDEGKAKLMGYIWDYAWEVSDGDLAVYNLIKDALMFGTAIGQEYYWQDRRLVQTTEVGKNKKEEKVEHEVYDYDDVYLEVVKLQDFFVDEKARGFTGSHQARDAIRRYIMNFDDFQRFFYGDVWNPLNNAKYVVPGGDTNYYEYFRPSQPIDTSKEVEILWYWSKTPKDRLIIVANDVLIKDGPNPYKHKQLPFVRCLDVKRVHRFYGKGEPEILESVHDESTTLRRMIIDRNHLDIDKMFFVSRNLSLSDEDLIARPHGMIPTDDVNAAKAVEYGDVPRSVELSLKYLEDDATISTGINPRAQALPTAGTATEAAILKESTLRRIDMKIWMMKKEFLTHLARLRVANILQFYSQPKLKKIVGDKNDRIYQDEVARLRDRGLLVEMEGEPYQAEYKQIRMEGSSFESNEKGVLEEKPSEGLTFLDLKPDYFMPVARGGYDIRFDVTSNIDISKPLMQSKILEAYDRIMLTAQTFPGTYDPVKLTDWVIKDAYDKDPNDFKPDEVVQNEQTQFLDTLVQLASVENQQMMQEKALPPTPYASPIHTRVHVEFMNSPEFQALDNESPVIQMFSDHVMGELMAQGMREQGGVGAPKQENPSVMEGEMMAGNGQFNQGGRTNGMQNRPGGAKSTKNKIGDVMPSLITGGNRNLP